MFGSVVVLRVIQVLVISGAVLSASGPVYRWGRGVVERRTVRAAWKGRFDDGGGGWDESMPSAWLRGLDADLDLPVLVAASKRNLMRFPCFISGNEANLEGLCAIAGHRDKHFRPLEHVEPGAVLELETRAGGCTKYRVVDTEVLSPDIVMERLSQKMGERWLVLVTCYPFRYVGPAPKRYLVWAAPVNRRSCGELNAP